MLCQGNVALRKIPVLMKHLLLISDSCFYCLVSLQSGCFVRAVGFSSPSLFSPPTGADCPTPGGYCLGRCPAALIALAPRAEPASVPLGECLKCTKLGLQDLCVLSMTSGANIDSASQRLQLLLLLLIQGKIYPCARAPC